MVLALNNPLRLICHETKKSNWIYLKRSSESLSRYKMRIIIIYSLRVFHTSLSWWSFTGVWVIASLLKFYYVTINRNYFKIFFFFFKYSWLYIFWSLFLLCFHVDFPMTTTTTKAAFPFRIYVTYYFCFLLFLIDHLVCHHAS